MADSRGQDWAAFVAAVGSIISQFGGGAPDCWPSIRGVANAITNAANRATSRAWSVVDERDATIRALTAQLDSALSTGYYRQHEFDVCSGELASANKALGAAKQELLQLQAQVNLDELQVSRIPQIVAQRDEYWKAEKRRQEAPLEQRIKELEGEIGDVLRLLTRWRNAFPGLGPEHAAKQFHDALNSERTDEHVIAELRRELAAAVAIANNLERELSACRESCASNVLVIQRNCERQVQAYYVVIVQLRKEIEVVTKRANDCTNQYRYIVGLYNNCTNQITQCNTELTRCKQTKPICTQCTTITGRPGTCSGVCKEIRANG